MRGRTPVLLLLLLSAVEPSAAKKKRTKKKVKADGPPGAAEVEAMRHHQQGVMAHVQGDPKGAIAAFRRAVGTKPDFAYAYYRLGFVMEEQRRRKKAAAVDDDDDEALSAFVMAASLDPKDEMAAYALGDALHDRARHDEAERIFHGITTTLNPRSAQAYWALGKVRAVDIDEFDSDPSDPRDPFHCYEHAARLKPDEFQPDGTRVKRVEPMTPEREEREEREARERRQQVLAELKDGRRTLNYGDGDEHEAEPRAPQVVPS